MLLLLAGERAASSARGRSSSRGTSDLTKEAGCYRATARRCDEHGFWSKLLLIL